MWYGACNASCRKYLQRIVRAAEKIVGVSLPSLQDIYSTRLTRKALCIAGDPTHLTHNFFSLLPSGRRLRSLQARTSRLKDSFIHQAVRKLNSLPSLPPLPSLTPCTTELSILYCAVLTDWFFLNFHSSTRNQFEHIKQPVKRHDEQLNVCYEVLTSTIASTGQASWQKPQ